MNAMTAKTIREGSLPRRLAALLLALAASVALSVAFAPATALAADNLDVSLEASSSSAWTYGSDVYFNIAFSYTGSEPVEVCGYTLEVEGKSIGGNRVDASSFSDTVVWKADRTGDVRVDLLVSVALAGDDEEGVVVSDSAHEYLLLQKAPLTVTANDQTLPYNGEVQGEGDTVYDNPDVIEKKITSKGLKEGDYVAQIEIFSQGEAAGTYPITVDKAVIRNVTSQEDVTANYEITYVKGTLTIEEESYEIAATADPAEGGEVTGAGKYAEGADVTLTATPKTGYSFVNWTENGSAVPNAEATYTFKATGDRSLVANFKLQEYTVKFVNYDGTVLQSGKVEYGKTPEYTGATPTRPETAECTYEFSGWTPEITAVTGDATYTAKFAEKAKKGVYEAVSGAGGTWTQGSNDPLVFTFKRTVDDATTFGHFAGILVDGKEVLREDASGRVNWTAAKGSVIVSLQPAYLTTLSEGSHTLTARFNDGDDVTVSFTIPAKAQPASNPAATPRTGDGNGLLVAGLSAAALLALGVIVAYAVRRRRA